MPIPAETLTPQQLGYIAGLIDGEGSVLIKKMVLGYSYRLDVSINNTDIRVMDWLQDVLGGSVTSGEASMRNGIRNKPIIRWCVTGEYAMALLEAILPCLVIKKEQAEIGIAFQQAKKDWGLSQGIKTPEVFRQIAQMLKEAIECYNSKLGVSNATIC